MTVAGELHGIDGTGLRLHLYTDDGRLNMRLLGAQAVPRVGETFAMSGVVHEVQAVHWTLEPATALFGSTSFHYQEAHLRLRPIAQEGTPGEVLR